jgi:putative phage-type endonuclease
MEQGSAEWVAARVGKVGASRVADIIAKTKSGWSASRATYMGQLIAERLSGTPMESFSSAAMQWGTDCEPEARAAYQFETTTLVTRAGFIQHPTIEMAGASPDGLVGETGLVEIKCPNTSTHIETLLGQSVPAKYVTQMMWQMATTGRGWCDFVSFDKRMPEHMRLFIKRVPRDPETIKTLEGEVITFLAELDEKVAELTKRYGMKEAA